MIGFRDNQRNIVYGGTSKTFILQIDVANEGLEPAYEANMKLNYSTDFKINSIDADGVSMLKVLSVIMFLSNDAELFLNSLNFFISNLLNAGAVNIVV